MEEGGLDETIRAAGSSGVVMRSFGKPRPSSVERSAATSERAHSAGLLSDPPQSSEFMKSTAVSEVDEVDQMRANEYALLAIVFGRAPTREVLAHLAELKGDATPLGVAHIELAQAAATADPDAISREYFDLFVGVGRGELLPYGSYYLTGFLHERPLVRVRADLAELGIERTEANREPEDHIAVLCEVMSGLASGRFGSEPGADRAFFERHLKPWAGRFFVDCETAQHGRFYKVAGALGRMFMEIEAEAFAMDA
jgi:TorA maturation chaperone TorD